MLENELQNQRFTQWLNKHFNHSLASNQYPEFRDPERLESIRLHFEKLWKESNNVNQWTNAVKAYLKQKNLDKKFHIKWNILDHMDQHQHKTLILEPRGYILKNLSHSKLSKLTNPNCLVEPTTYENIISLYSEVQNPSHPTITQEHPMINGIAIGAP